MLSDMLSSFLTLIVTHCNASTYQLPCAPNPCQPKRANELGPEGVPRRRSGEMESPMTLDGVLSARAGWLARRLSLLDLELL